MDAINWHSLFFLLFAMIACAFAVAVVVSGNIVRMACYLVVSLSAVAALFFLAGADFLGAAQLMVYVGGTLVLLVFGVMLTARGPFMSLKIGGGQWIVAVFIGGALLAVLLQAAFHISDGTPAGVAKGIRGIETPRTATPIGYGLLGLRADKAEQEVKVLRDGMSGYLLPFEIISIHLVVVLVGAAYLARARRRVAKRTSVVRDQRVPDILDYVRNT